jgi:hemoglobin-like flavoprotein
MMTLSQINAVRDSFKALAPHGDELAERFFDRLFERQPALRAVLPQDHWMRSRDLLTGLGTLVKNLHRLDAINHVLMEFGTRAQRAGVLPQHYGIAREIMLETMREMLGDEFGAELENDWRQTLTSVSSVVLVGAGRSRAKAA